MRVVTALICLLVAGHPATGDAASSLVARHESMIAPTSLASAQFAAALAISGDTVVVGAPNDDGAAERSGAAYVLVRENETWTVQATLTASDGAFADDFGRSVAIDGDTIVVGAESDDDDVAGSASGSAYVFVRSGSIWTEEAKLTADDAAQGDFFGVSVGVSGDTVAVGAFYDQDAGFASGSAYVFERSASVWSQTAKLVSADLEADDYFGLAIAIDGDTILVGVPESDDAGSQSGSAYVFVRSSGTWSEQAKLTAGNAFAGAFFGFAVALSGDTAAISTQPLFFASGSVSVFVRDGVAWSEQAELRSPAGDAADAFGHGVAIAEDLLVVGAIGTDAGATRTGAAHLFGRSGSSWERVASIVSSIPVENSYFGTALALAGETLVVGAPADVGTADAGAAFLYELAPGQNTGGSLRITTQHNVSPPRSRVVYDARAALSPPAPASSADPRCGSGNGGSFTVTSPTSGHGFSQSLPCARWRLLGDPSHPRGYVYRDPARSDGPCTRVTLRDGVQRVSCSGSPTHPLSFVLEQGDREPPVTAILGVGTETYCARFGGQVTQDGTDGRRFAARRASTAPACD